METNPLKRVAVILQEDTVLNQEIIDELDILLKLITPQDMNKVLIYVFFMYIYYAENDVYCSDLKNTSEIFYLLIDFFTKAGELKK
ncbi:hypothetical protein [Sporocytophaga myxococcoides]|uniref:hypothetical protein n=1 Tax=Sporocytophaga myxococcoides TaxID=153721 RepID=UPI0003FD0025|nr:hypothetical protein [Sporocytophaga myxococcoides]